jgi:hypothetical protein
MGFNSACKGLNKKQNVEIDSPALSGGQGKYMKNVKLHLVSAWAALLNCNVSLFVYKTIFEKELIKTKETAINAES